MRLCFKDTLRGIIKPFRVSGGEMLCGAVCYQTISIQRTRAGVLSIIDTTRTWDGVGRLGHSSFLVEDLHREAVQHRAVEPVPHHEGPVPSVQRGRDVDTEVLLLVQRTYLHLECVFTLSNTCTEHVSDLYEALKHFVVR